jgi:hypothetical protein
MLSAGERPQEDQDRRERPPQQVERHPDADVVGEAVAAGAVDEGVGLVADGVLKSMEAANTTAITNGRSASPRSGRSRARREHHEGCGRVARSAVRRFVAR